MTSPTKFGRHIAAGFATTVLAAILIALVSFFAMKSVLNSTGKLAVTHSRDLTDIERLRALVLQETASYRGYLFSRDHVFLEDAKLSSDEFTKLLESITARSVDHEDSAMLAKIKTSYAAHRASLLGAVAKRKAKMKYISLRNYFDMSIMPRFDDLEQALGHYSTHKAVQYEKARYLAEESSHRALSLIVIIAITSILLATALAFILTRTLTKLYSALQLAVTARDDLMAMASHDLKNPLASILMTCSLNLKYAGRMQPKEGFETIQRSGRQMRQLIDDLLDLSKITAGHLVLDFKYRNPALIVNEVIEVLRPVAGAKDIVLSAEVGAQVPLLRCDKHRLVQVLSNLVGNAIKFTAPGGEVAVRFYKASDSTAMLEVRDTGPGIAPAELPYVFDRYWKSNKKSRSGTGLGLFIAKNIVEAHGGRIWVESSRGHGSTFYVGIPILAAPRAITETNPTDHESQPANRSNSA